VPDGGLLIGRPQRTNGRETNPTFCSALFRFRRTQAIDSAWRSFRLETIAQSKWGFMGSTGYESEGNGRYSVYSTSVLSEGRRENSTCFHDFGCSALDALVFCFQLKRNLPSCWLRVRFSSPAPESLVGHVSSKVIDALIVDPKRCRRARPKDAELLNRQCRECRLGWTVFAISAISRMSVEVNTRQRHRFPTVKRDRRSLTHPLRKSRSENGNFRRSTYRTWGKPKSTLLVLGSGHRLVTILPRV
jgi:hypothetical protein